MQPSVHAGRHSAAGACLEEEHQLRRARGQPELVQRLLVAVAAMCKRRGAIASAWQPGAADAPLQRPGEQAAARCLTARAAPRCGKACAPQGGAALERKSG